MGKDGSVYDRGRLGNLNVETEIVLDFDNVTSHHEAGGGGGGGNLVVVGAPFARRGTPMFFAFLVECGDVSLGYEPIIFQGEYQLCGVVII